MSLTSFVFKILYKKVINCVDTSTSCNLICDNNHEFLQQVSKSIDNNYAVRNIMIKISFFRSNIISQE